MASMSIFFTKLRRRGDKDKQNFFWVTTKSLFYCKGKDWHRPLKSVTISFLSLHRKFFRLKGLSLHSLSRNLGNLVRLLLLNGLNVVSNVKVSFDFLYENENFGQANGGYVCFVITSGKSWNWIRRMEELCLKTKWLWRDGRYRRDYIITKIHSFETVIFSSWNYIWITLSF